MFINYFILFLAMAKFKQACFAHHLSKKFHTFYTQVIFGCTRHSFNKFGSALVGTKILRSTILKQAFIVLTYWEAFHSQCIQYDSTRVQRHHHHKEHAKVKYYSLVNILCLSEHTLFLKSLFCCWIISIISLVRTFLKISKISENIS